MVGNRVRVVTSDGFPSSGAVEGVLHVLNEAGATVWRTMHDAQATVFIPMHRIREIVDLGRMP